MGSEESRNDDYGDMLDVNRLDEPYRAHPEKYYGDSAKLCLSDEKSRQESTFAI